MAVGLLLPFALILLGILPSSADAQSTSKEDFAELAAQCADAISSAPDKRAARLEVGQIAEQLEDIAREFNASTGVSDLLPELNGKAANCVSFARQMSGGVEFSPDSGRYVSKGFLRSQRQAEEHEKEHRKTQLEAAELAARIKSEEEKQRLLNLQINSRVFQACEALSRQDSVAAFTNALCVESFRQNGLPYQ